MPAYIDYKGKSIEIPDMSYKDEVMSGLKNGTLDTSVLDTASARPTEISKTSSEALDVQSFINDMKERGGKALMDAPPRLLDELAFNVGRVGHFLFDTPLEGVAAAGDPGKSLTTGSGQTLRLRPEVADAAVMFTPGSALKVGGTAAIGAASLLKLMSREIEKSGLKPITKALKGQQGMIGGEKNINPDLLSLARKYIAKERVKFNERFKEEKKLLKSRYKAYHKASNDTEKQRLFVQYNKLARKLLAESPEYSTYKKFGIYPGKDGVWREVISDAGATIGPESLARLRSGGPIYTTMGELMDHQELYKKYPDLAKRKVKVIPDTKNEDIAKAAGYYGLNPTDTNEPIEIIRYVDDEQGIKDTISTLLHENQHAIQNLEGMGTGGSPVSTKGYIKEDLSFDKDTITLEALNSSKSNYRKKLLYLAHKYDNAINSIDKYTPDDVYDMLLGERDALVTQRMFEMGNFNAFPESMKPVSPDVKPDIVLQSKE